METLWQSSEKNSKLSVDRSPACNRGFKKLAVQWLYDIQFLDQTSLLVDIFAL